MIVILLVTAFLLGFGVGAVLATRRHRRYSVRFTKGVLAFRHVDRTGPVSDAWLAEHRRDQV